MVQLSLSNRQRKHRLPPLRKLRRQLEAAVRLIIAERRPLPSAVEIHFVGNAAMCQVHAQFLNDPAPTDVITFPYGEILVCPEVAVTQAPLFKRTFEQEILLYAIHGLLHLAGYDDVTKALARAMHKRQDEVLAQVLAEEPFQAAPASPSS